MAAGRKRLLVVDDDPDMVNVIKKRLARRGYDVSTASTGARALRRLRKEPCDCLLLDLLLPDISGREIMETIAKEEILPLSRVIVLTGVHNVQNATAYMQYGAFAYLGKPFDFDYLAQTISRCCKDDGDTDVLEAVV